jgi:hypothetical protein
VSCNYLIPNVIGQQAYSFFSKIHVRLVAGGAPVTVKCRAVNWSTKVGTSAYKDNVETYQKKIP